MAEHPREEDLHQYFDGELRARRAEKVRAHVETCDKCTADLAQFSGLHGMMLAAADEAASQVHSEALFARVSAGLDEVAEPGFGERVAMWWESLLEPWQPRGVWVPATMAAAVTLAVFFVSFPANGPAPVAEQAATRTGEAPAEPAKPATPAMANATMVPTPILRSEIVQVDFGKNAGTVFEIALGDETTTPVIWINDEEDEE